MPSRTIEIANLAGVTTEWLRDERAYQFAKNLQTHQANPVRSYNHITHEELPDKWHRFQSFQAVEARLGGDLPGQLVNMPILRMQTTQQILKVCAGANAARVWDLAMHGADVEAAKEQAFGEVESYLADTDRLVAHIPEPSVLRQSFDEAFVRYVGFKDEHDSQALLMTEHAAGLAIARLLKQSQADGEVFVPLGGVSSGNIERGYIGSV